MRSPAAPARPDRVAAGDRPAAASAVAGLPAAPPRLLVLTDRRQTRWPLPDVVRAAVAGGARAVLLRERDLPPDRRAALAEELATALAVVGGRLLLSGTDPAPAVHLPAGAAVPAPRPTLVGRSCHTVAEARASSDVDYVTVSPVFPTASKPGYGPALGLDGLWRRVRAAPVPVYALGGVDAATAAGCLAAGAAGVAVLGVVMRAADPAAVVRRLIEALDGVPSAHTERRPVPTPDARPAPADRGRRTRHDGRLPGGGEAADG